MSILWAPTPPIISRRSRRENVGRVDYKKMVGGGGVDLTADLGNEDEVGFILYLRKNHEKTSVADGSGRILYTLFYHLSQPVRKI